MQELVGKCKQCHKMIYCNDGFFGGHVMEDQSLLCFECFGNEEKLSSKRDNKL